MQSLVWFCAALTRTASIEHPLATGKAMLAYMPDDYLERFRPHLRRYAETTRTTIQELREDIELARAQGYSSVLHGEWREGIAACACAIIGRSGELVGSEEGAFYDLMARNVIVSAARSSDVSMAMCPSPG